MKSDFDMIVKHFPENNSITIIPISDVHIGAAEHMEREWNRFCNLILSTPNIYLTLGGDLINNSTRSSVANVFDETIRPREQKKIVAEMLTPIRDRILCITSGNHERRSLKDADDDPGYDIACKLDLENIYRENMAFVKIQVGKLDGNGAKNPTYMMGVTHGSGGGIYTGANVNRQERFAYAIDGLDVLISGHSHKPFLTMPAKIYIDKYNNQISLKPFHIVVSSSWLNYGGYALQKQLLPGSNCVQEILLGGDKKEIRITM